MLSLRVSQFVLLVVALCRLDCAAFTPSRSISSPLTLTSTLHSSVNVGIGITLSTPPQQQQQQQQSLSITLLRMKDDDEEEKEKDEPMTEEESSRKVFQRLDLPRRIGETVNSVAVVFVVCGLLLNVFGYGYVVKDNYMLTIDTLENRQFQRELGKSTKESAKNMRVAPTSESSKERPQMKKLETTMPSL